MQRTAGTVALCCSDPDGVKSGICTMQRLRRVARDRRRHRVCATQEIESAAGKLQAIREEDKTPVFNIYIKTS
jgi:hypothetical protein